ncbi:hypothetical protein GW796_10330 [archaeon]|nr:hypothetical protein [archaeon]
MSLYEKCYEIINANMNVYEQNESKISAHMQNRWIDAFEKARDETRM